MEPISQFTSLLDSLGWAVLHSLWQVTLAALLLAVFLRVLPTGKSQYRYGISYGILGICGAAFVFTFAHYWQATTSTEFALAAAEVNAPQVTFLNEALTLTPTPANSTLINWQILIGTWTPYIAFVWGIGVLFYSLKYSTAFLRLRRLRRQGLSPVPAEWISFFVTSTQQAGIRRACQLFYSSAVTTPLTIGCAKPIVLVPLGFFLQLSPAQAEAVLWHEIAHIKRYDYYWNLLQLAIKSLLFFHPGIHFISACIEREREYVCDDFAVRHTGGTGPLIKALGLLRIQSFHLQNTLAMSVLQKKHPFVQRLQRLFDSSSPREPLAGGRVLMLLILVLAASMVWAYQADRPRQPFEAEVPLSAEDPINEPMPDEFIILTDTVPHVNEREDTPPAPPLHVKPPLHDSSPAPVLEVKPPLHNSHPAPALQVKPPLPNSHPAPALHPANRVPEAPAVAPAQGLNGVVAPAPRARGTAQIAPSSAFGYNGAPRVASAASPIASGYAAALPAQAETLFGIADSLPHVLARASEHNESILLSNGQAQGGSVLFENPPNGTMIAAGENGPLLMEGSAKTGSLLAGGAVHANAASIPLIASAIGQQSDTGEILRIDQLKRVLLRALLNDQLVENRLVKIVLNYQEDSITINGRALPNSLHEKYTRIFANHQVNPGPHRTVRISPKYIMVGDYTPETGFSGHMSGTIDIENDLK